MFQIIYACNFILAIVYLKILLFIFNSTVYETSGINILFHVSESYSQNILQLLKYKKDDWFINHLPKNRQQIAERVLWH